MPLSRDVIKQYEDVVLGPLWPSLGVGAVTGASGLFFGGLAGIATSAHPRLFAAVAGLQWFGLGSSFWYIRSALILGQTDGHPTPNQELRFSAAAGSLSGALSGALRSRSNIIPASIMVGIFGLVGQTAVQVFSKSDTSAPEQGSFLQRLARKKWVPLRSLSDSEYATMLSENLIRTEAEIAIIDEKISDLQQSSAGRVSRNIDTLP